MTDGIIYKTSKSCYQIYFKGKYICSCRTHEQAYYVRQELDKNNWDTTELQSILNEYPKYYTQLLYFYQYIHYSKKSDNWRLLLPKTKTQSPSQEYITYDKLEDALYERDFLMEHDWDYEVLVECIDDNKNPYYNMELPPFPERRIKNVQKPKTHATELLLLQEIILEEPDILISQTAQKIGYSIQTIRNWLKKYNIDFLDYKTLVLSGENPLEKLQLKEKIYTPDLSPSKPNFKNHVQHHKRSKHNPYVIVNSNHESFGWYPNRKIAEKIAKDLKRCGWDRTQLPKIRAKHNFTPPQKRRNFVYPTSSNKFVVRKDINDKKVSFGTYQTKEIAEHVRDKLLECNWDKEELTRIQTEVAKEFGGVLH